MKFSIISSLEYGKGRVLLMCCRFNNLFTGNHLLDQSFSRSCLEWVSSKGEQSILDVATIVNTNVNGGAVVINDLDMVNVRNLSIEDLSEYSLIQNLSCILIFGIDNSISPVIRSNIAQYVSSGGGLILSDINVNQENILLLDDISPVYCEDSGVNLPDGRSIWTEEGVSSFIFGSGDYADISIFPLNTIYQSGLSSSWNMLYVYDTDQSDEDPTPPVEVDGPVYLSCDYDIRGANFVGYYASVYRDGQFDIKKS